MGKYNVTPESITVSSSSDDLFAAYSATERAGTSNPQANSRENMDPPILYVVP